MTDDATDAATDDDRAEPPDGALDTDVAPPPHDRPVPAVAGSSRATGSLWAPAERTTRRPLFRWHSPEDDGGGPWLYEIQVDDSCAPGSGSLCVFSSPEAQASGIAGTSWQPADDLAVSESPPVGRSYGWRVRGCRGSSCTAWSLVAFVGVGRVPKDFDGDGFSDVAVGGDGRTAETAIDRAVYVFRGGAAGIEPTPYVVLENPLHPGIFDAFAWDLAAPGDVGVYLYRGSQAGLGIEPYADLSNPDGRVSAMTSGRLAVDDLDGNGLSDLLVALPLGPIGWTAPGIVFLYSADAGRFPTSPGLTLSSPTPEDAVGSWRGHRSSRGCQRRRLPGRRRRLRRLRYCRVVAGGCGDLLRGRGGDQSFFLDPAREPDTASRRGIRIVRRVTGQRIGGYGRTRGVHPDVTIEAGTAQMCREDARGGRLRVQPPIDSLGDFRHGLPLQDDRNRPTGRRWRLPTDRPNRGPQVRRRRHHARAELDEGPPRR